jgi:hypothetical protein
MLTVNQGCGAVSLRDWCPMIGDTILPRIFGCQSPTDATPPPRRTENSTTPIRRSKDLIVNTLGNETLSFPFKFSSKNVQKASARKPDPFRISKSGRIIFICFGL